MRRRDFITLLGGAAATWPLAAGAQQPKMPVIGVLSNASSDLYADRVRIFRQGLGETGFVEGRNVSIEYRWAEDQDDRLPAMAADLVRRQVTVIVAMGGGNSALAAKSATTTIPIVFHVGVDPVQYGLVASLNRPGGNLTGVTNLTFELGPKRLELLHELVPSATIIAVLLNPTVRSAGSLASMQAAALTLGLQLHVFQASTESEIDAAFAAMAKLRVDGLLIGASPLFNARSEQLAALALRHAVPAIYQYREFAAAGGLMSYGASNAELFRTAGVYTGRILKGDKPSDLPVQQATRIELVINMKTAKALGITFPITLLGRADEVIE